MKKQMIGTIAAISISYLALSTVAHAMGTEHKMARMDHSSQHTRTIQGQNSQADHVDQHGHHTHTR